MKDLAQQQSAPSVLSKLPPKTRARLLVAASLQAGLEMPQFKQLLRNQLTLAYK